MRKSKGERMAERLAGVRHRLWGKAAQTPVPGTVFDPLAFLADPGRLRDCLAWWRWKAYRSGVGAGLPKELRESALDDAAQNTLQVFLDRNYKKAGITADETFRAVAGAAGIMKRGFYVLSIATEGFHGRRQEFRRWYPFNGIALSRFPNPAKIVAETFNAAEDREALTGEDDAPGKTVDVPGGPGGRGITDGKMVQTETVTRTWVERDADGELQELCEIVTGWKMERKRGRQRHHKPCTVNRGKRAPRMRYVRSPMPVAVPATEGDGTETRATRKTTVYFTPAE